MSRFISMNTVKKRLPVLSWIKGYNAHTFVADMVAGFTVGLMLIPQALAYGIMAGLSPSNGLYAGWTGPLVYFFLGTTKELSIGPTAILNLLVAPYTARGGAAYAILLCFTSGIIQLITAIFNLGFLINFISQPVINGFTTAAVVQGASAQLKPLLGLKLKTSGTLNTWLKVMTNISEFRWQDLTLGLICMAALTFIKVLPTLQWQCVKKLSHGWGLRSHLSNGRNALVVIASSIIAVLVDGDNQPFTLTGHVEAGIPPAAVPPFSVTIGNDTLGFMDIMGEIESGVIMIPFIAIVYTIGIIGSFAKGRTIDATQEILALSVANIAGSFFGSMPITCAMSRAAVNSSSGVKTPMGGLMTGAMVLLALMYLTPYFRFIPKSTLAAVIICALLNIFDYQMIQQLWRSTRRELIPYIITFLACFFLGLSTGILIGIAVNLCILLLFVAKPKIIISSVVSSEEDCRYVQVKVSHGIQYPSSSHVRTAISKAGIRDAHGVEPVVVDCSQLHALDYTAAKGLANLSTEFKERNQPLVFLDLNPAIISNVGSLLSDLTVCADKDKLYYIMENGTMGNGSTTTKFLDVSKSTLPATEYHDISKPMLSSLPHTYTDIM